MKATYKKYTLNFKVPSGTSRGVMTQKETWFLILENNGSFGIGECGILRGLVLVENRHTLPKSWHPRAVASVIIEKVDASFL